MADESKFKQRLVGAIVLVSLAVILLPALIDYQREPEQLDDPVQAPPPPAYRDYQSRVVPIEIPPAPKASDNQGAVSRSQAASAPVARAPAPPLASAVKSMATPARRLEQGWVVQVGTFSESARADKVHAELIAQGFTAYIEPFLQPKGPLYRVRVGPDFLREEAEALQQKLQKDTEFTGIVLPFP